MSLNELLQRWIGKRSASRRSRPQATRRRGLRLTLEQLEDRCLPSSYTAASVSDLIADINTANQAGGSNTITLVAGNTFGLTAVNNTTDGATGLPVIAANDNLTIVGNGDSIARAAGTPAFRLFDVATAASLTLQNLTLQGGWAFGYVAEGGAIYSQGTLDLNGVTVQNNVAQGTNGSNGPAGMALGGGIYSSGSLTLEGGTTVQNNQALGGVGLINRIGGDGLGGGLYVAGGTVTLTGASLSANTAHGGQGAPAYPPSPRGYRYAARAGGNGGGGGVYVAAGTVTLTSVILSANTAQGGQGGDGNSRTFPQGATGGNGLGGGLDVAGGTVILHNDTVTSNTAQGGPGGSGSPAGSPGLGEGGGLFIDPAAAVCLDAFTQAQITNNTASTKDPNIHGPWKTC